MLSFLIFFLSRFIRLHTEKTPFRYNYIFSNLHYYSYYTYIEKTIFVGNKDLADLELRKLINAKDLIEIGKFNDALQLLIDFSENSAITLFEQISYYILMSFIFIKLGKKEELFEYAEKAYQSSQGQKNSFQLVDVYFVKAISYMWEYKYDKVFELIVKSEKLCNILSQEPLNKLLKRKADVAWINGLFCSAKGNFDKGLDYAEQSLKLRENLDLKADIVMSLSLIKEIYYATGNFDRALDYTEQCLKKAIEIDYKRHINLCYHSKGLIYTERGELEAGIEYLKKSLAIAEELNDNFGIGACLNNLGIVYHQQGQLSLAQENLERSLKIFKEYGSPGFTSIDSLFHIALDNNDLELAQKYLEHLEQLNDQYDLKEIDVIYRVDKAIFLKTSLRAINRGKAEEMLKQVVEEEIVNYDIIIIALLHLSDLLLDELQSTSDIEIIDELRPYILKLLNIAEKNHSYSILAEAYILQAKMALVTLELKDTRQLLTKAQSIAEKYHLNRLAVKISSEHDELLKKLSIWREIKESNAPLGDRIKLSRLTEQLDHMIHKGAVEPLEIPDEEPVVVLIVSESGEPVFSYLFDEEWNFEDHLIGGFLTAINSFSDEMFSQGLDRATFGEFNLFMKSISPFLVCYLYKGPSYLARQRIKHFTDNIQIDKDIWETINKFLITSQLVQLKDIPKIKPLINDIFIEKNIKLDVFESKAP